MAVMMALAMLLIFMAFIMLIAFLQSALILLPWTLSAALLAALTSIVLGKLLRNSPTISAIVTVFGSFALTLGYGFLGYHYIVPQPSGPTGWTILGGVGSLSQTDLTNTFPMHLAITAVLCMLLTACYWYQSVMNVRRSASPVAIPPVVIEASASPPRPVLGERESGGEGRA